jgi:ABC-type thiamine transport system ATPase subunit
VTCDLCSSQVPGRIFDATIVQTIGRIVLVAFLILACGKLRSLRIAGLEKISIGMISIGDKAVNDLEPKDRGISMVFQSYALYPHMNFSTKSFKI